MHIQRKAAKISRCPRHRSAAISASPAHVHPSSISSLAWRNLAGEVLRSISLARATLHLHCKAATYKLRRLCYLWEAKIFFAF